MFDEASRNSCPYFPIRNDLPLGENCTTTEDAILTNSRARSNHSGPSNRGVLPNHNFLQDEVAVFDKMSVDGCTASNNHVVSNLYQRRIVNGRRIDVDILSDLAPCKTIVCISKKGRNNVVEERLCGPMELATNGPTNRCQRCEWSDNTLLKS